MMDAILSWLLTYFIHSTVLLGAAGLLCLALGKRRLGLQEAVLRAALLGAFLTTGLQLTLHLKPLGGSLALPLPQAEEASLAPSPQPSASGFLAMSVVPAHDADLLATLTVPPTSAPLPESPTTVTSGAVAGKYWRLGFLVLWVGLSLVAAARLAHAARGLRRLLVRRQPLKHGPVAAGARAIAETLGLRGPVRLSTATRLAVPLATGVLRPEVCLPTRVLTDLREDEQLALCAHELAHVVRRDPAWLLLARLCEALAPLQPLNRWARRRLSDLAECLSDDLAVSASAQPLGLARSLVDVASWTVAVPVAVPATASAAFGPRSRLAYRVERLMDPVRRLERPRRIVLALTGMATLATVFVVPVVSGSGSDRSKAKSVPPAVSSQPAPTATAAPITAPVPIVAPAAAPAAPVSPSTPPVPPAPPVVDRSVDKAAHTAEAIEQLTRRIEERARGHESEIAKMGAEIGASFAPQGEEMARLAQELAKAAGEMAKEIGEQLASGQGALVRHGRNPEAERHLAELRHRVAELARSIRIPPEQLHALRQKAHALAKGARPTDQELAEIRSLVGDLAHATTPHLEVAALAANQAVERAQLELRGAQERLHQAQERARHAQEQARRAAGTTRHAGEDDAAPQSPAHDNEEAQP